MLGECSARGASVFYAAKTDLARGELCLELGEIEHGRELLTAALTVATANGYTDVERRAIEALR